MTSIALPQEDTVAALDDRAFAQATDDRPRTTDRDDVLARNRQNAKHSTGPRTPAGKERSSQNARKHNLTAATPPKDLAADPTYQLSKQEFIDEFQPNTPTQHILVSQLTHIAWKLDQIPKLEHQLLATPLGETTPADPDSDSGVASSAGHESPEDYIRRRLDDPNAPPAPKDPTNTITAEHLLQDRPTPLTRLWDHHRRLLANFQSIVRQIRQLQRQEHEPFLKEQRDRQRRRKEDHAFIDQYLAQVHQRNATQPAQTGQHLPTRTTPTSPKQNEPTSPSQISNPQPEIPSPPASVPSVPSVVQSASPSQNEPTGVPQVPQILRQLTP
jgi:hypothetical protein